MSTSPTRMAGTRLWHRVARPPPGARNLRRRTPSFRASAALSNRRGRRVNLHPYWCRVDAPTRQGPAYALRHPDADGRTTSPGRRRPMPCTRETPCGAILYEDSQSRELALAGIPRRVQKCLAGHSFWEGEILPDAIPSLALPAADTADGEDDDETQTRTGDQAARATSAAAGAASRPKPRNRDRRIGPPRARRSSA